MSKWVCGPIRLKKKALLNSSILLLQDDIEIFAINDLDID